MDTGNNDLKFLDQLYGMLATFAVVIAAVELSTISESHGYFTKTGESWLLASGLGSLGAGGAYLLLRRRSGWLLWLVVAGGSLLAAFGHVFAAYCHEPKRPEMNLAFTQMLLGGALLLQMFAALGASGTYFALRR